MADLRTPEVQAYWHEFCQRTGEAVDQRYDVYAFGDSPAMADELADLVINGPKRATAGLLQDFEPPTDPVPEIGVHSVVLDGAGQPVAVVRTTDVEVKRLDQVDDAFAWDEGEGDRTRADWLDGHRRYFTRQLAAQGGAFSDDLLTVFERFDLVWPVPADHEAPAGSISSGG